MAEPAEARWAVGVDVGGTRLSAGLVSSRGEVAVLERTGTPRAQGAPATLEALEALIGKVLAQAAGRPVSGIGVGFGGPVDYAAQQVRRSHHAAGWGGLLPAQWLGERSGLPAILENDANAGGLAEALYGAGRGAQTLLYVNIGTGVGGAVVLGGRIHHGANTNAGEFGHIVLDPTGPPCPCGKRGCVEALCSGDALGRTAREDAAAEPWEGVAASDLTGRKVGGMAREGDGRALAVVERSAEWMGLALAGAANLLDPDAIVLGGGVSEMGEVYLGLVRRAFAQYAMPLPAANTPIAAAALGYDAGFVGAAAVVFAGIGGDGGARPGGRQG